MKKSKIKYPKYNTNTPIHKIDLCSNPQRYHELLQVETDLKRKIAHFSNAGDSKKEIEESVQYKELLSSPLNIYRMHLATQIMDSKRMSLAATVQFVGVSAGATSLKQAILSAFRGTKSTLQLTKEEHKFLKFLYQMGQADLQQRMVDNLFYNDKSSSNMKLLAQMKEFIEPGNNPSNLNTNNPNHPNHPSNNPNNQPTLNINLTKKKQKAKRKKDDNTNPNTNQTPEQDNPGPLDIN